MPLSEQEQRLLEEMERSLYHNDADYVAGAAGNHGRPSYSRIASGVLVGVVGIGALVTGVAVRVPLIGVVGFALMFLGVLLALTPPRAHGVTRSTEQPDSATASGGTYRQNPGPIPNHNDWDKHTDDHTDNSTDNRDS